MSGNVTRTWHLTRGNAAHRRSQPDSLRDTASTPVNYRQISLPCQHSCRRRAQCIGRTSRVPLVFGCPLRRARRSRFAPGKPLPRRIQRVLLGIAFFKDCRVPHLVHELDPREGLLVASSLWPASRLAWDTQPLRGAVPDQSRRRVDPHHIQRVSPVLGASGNAANPCAYSSRVTAPSANAAAWSGGSASAAGTRTPSSASAGGCEGLRADGSPHPVRPANASARTSGRQRLIVIPWSAIPGRRILAGASRAQQHPTQDWDAVRAPSFRV